MESGSPQGRPRSKSTFSFMSNKSDKSDGKKPKISLHETAEERHKGRFTTKKTVNPNVAIEQAQPSTRALYDATTLSPIRAIQHRDAFGNPILDPDKANPTRPRLERPLDTIRSFEAAIDNGYKRRTQMQQAETAPAGSPMTGYSSRRSSFHGSDVPPSNPRHSPAGGHGSSRLNSLHRSTYADGYNSNGSGYPPSGARGNGQRFSSAPSYAYRPGHDHGMSPVHQYHESHDTVNTVAESSGSASEPWGNSTGPSSENSSIDRLSAANRPETGDAYAGGIYGRGSPKHGAIMEGYEDDSRNYAPQPQYTSPGLNNSPYAPQPQFPAQNGQQRDLYPRGPSNGSAPNGMRSFVPTHQQPQPTQQAAQRHLIKLGGEAESPPFLSTGKTATKAPPYRPVVERKASEKKTGWLKRRLNKD